MPLIDKPLSELETYAGINPRPADFDAYWEAALAEISGIDPAPEMRPASDIHPASAETFDLWFTGVGGARIYAKYLRPKNPPSCHPAILEFHGYTGQSGDWSDKLRFVAAGASVAAMDCRGQAGRSEDLTPVRGNTHHGHIIRGLADSAEKLLFRSIFLDTVQLARVVATLPETDAERMACSGGSQGGALSLACASLSPHIVRCMSCFPFLSDYKRVWEMDLLKDAYAELRTFLRTRDPRHESFDAIFERLGYIDVHHLAPRITAEVLMGLSLMDTICPPSTQFAAYNGITAPKRRILYPDFGHEALPGINDTALDFLTWSEPQI
jgi:cephalosporin-C deacetylase